VDEEELAEPPRYTRETLPAGDALVCRHGAMWAARLIDGSPEVIVTISGHGADPHVVRLEPVTDLRPMLAARDEVFARLRERRRATPPPVLEPAEGVAAWRALAGGNARAADDAVTAAINHAGHLDERAALADERLRAWAGWAATA
jgi:hypothetical protein